LFDGIVTIKLHSNNVLIFFQNFSWQVIDEYDQSVHFVEIDIEEDPEIAEAAGIMGTPCVQFFKNKENLKLVLLDLFYYYFLSFIIFIKIYGSSMSLS